MITGITIENFKGIRDRIEFKLSPITLLFGANSAGKSSVLHAMQFLREIFCHRNVDPHKLGEGDSGTDLGGFHSFVHGKRADQRVTLGLSFDVPEEGFPNFKTRTLPELDDPDSLYWNPSEAWIEVTIAWSELLGRAYVAEYSVGFRDGDIELETDEPFATIIFKPGTLVSQLSISENHLCLECDMDNGDQSWLSRWHPLEADQLDLDESILSLLMGWANSNYAINSIGPGQPPFTNVLGVTDQTDALPRFSRPLRLDADWEWSERGSQVRGEQLPELADHLTELISQLVVGPGLLAQRLLSDSRFLGPLREVPPRNRGPLRDKSSTNWATGLPAWELLQSGSEKLVTDVNNWLGDRDLLNSGFQVDVKRFKELDLTDPLVIKLITGRAFDDAEDDDRLDITTLPTHSRLVVVPVHSEQNGIELAASDVGVGISQIIPVIVASLDGEDTLVSIEQPELHVHPRLQAEIADLFIEAIRVNRHQFIIETHSEHLILRLLRRIRDTEKGNADANRQLRTHDISINYIRQEEGASSVLQIDVDVKGEFIQPWPDDFFEIDFYERFN